MNSISQQTTLTFEARIAGVAVKSAKEDPYGGRTASGGQLEVRLLVAQPEPPRRPGIPWEHMVRGPGGTTTDTWKPRPETPAKGQSKHDFASLQRYYDAARARWDTEMEEFNRTMAGMRDRTIAYAQLVGLAAVFGNRAVSVVITPVDQDLLPGFGVALVEGAAPDGSAGP